MRGKKFAQRIYCSFPPNPAFVSSQENSFEEKGDRDEAKNSTRSPKSTATATLQRSTDQ